MTTARNRVVFDATWTASTHPTNFPGGDHFSPLIGAVHNDSVTFWALEGTATAGIESMAETGGTSTLAAEVRAEIPGSALAVINGSGTRSPGSATIQAVTVREDFPLVTLIAPSPDWFVGVSGLSLRNADGTWVDELEVVLYPLRGDGRRTRLQLGQRQHFTKGARPQSARRAPLLGRTHRHLQLHEGGRLKRVRKPGRAPHAVGGITTSSSPLRNSAARQHVKTWLRRQCGKDSPGVIVGRQVPQDRSHLTGQPIAYDGGRTIGFLIQRRGSARP